MIMDYYSRKNPKNWATKLPPDSGFRATKSQISARTQPFYSEYSQISVKWIYNIPFKRFAWKVFTKFSAKNSSFFFSKKYFPCSEFIYLFFIFLYNFFGVKNFSQKSCRKFFGSMQYLPINSVFYIFQQKYIHQRLGSSILGRSSWFLICAGMKLYFYLDFYKVKAFKDLVLLKEKKSRTPNRDNRMSSKQSVISSFGACLQKLAKIPWKLPQ